MRHVNPMLLVDDGGLWVAAQRFCPFVQMFDDRHQLRNRLLQIIQRPGFQRLCQNRVIGIGAGPADDAHCPVKIHSSLHQQSNQLRDNHGRVGIVDLDDHRLIQLF